MRSLLLSLLLSIPAVAGEHLRFLLPVGPGDRPSTAHAYVFNSGKETIRVVDQGGITQQTHADLGAAAHAAGASAGVNGGFFDPQGNPLGHFVADGKSVGISTASSPLTSGLIWSDGRKIGTARTTSFDLKASEFTQLLQAGPFLIENGAPVGGLETAKFSRRTIILTDGGKLWALAYVPSATLDGLAHALAKPGAFPSFSPKVVLNLDGGASSGLWIKRENGQQFYLREISKVRNFLIVVPRNQS
jgi:hypothetical protein